MARAKTNRLVIRTPEGIVFSQVLASPVSRMLACGLDLACVSLLSSLVGGVLGLLGLVSVDFARAVMVIAYFLIQIGYGIVTEWFWRGQTLGKKMLRLRVVDIHGMRLQFSQVVIRNLLRAVDVLPLFYVVGGLTSLINRRSQRLGDLAANTVVIRQPRMLEPNLDQLMSDKYNSIRDHPHLEARLRQRVSPLEAGIALQALVRREQLEPEARVQLFAEIAAHFRGLVEFPPDVTEGITDEQYVRNVVDVLYRPRGAKDKAGTSESKPELADAAK